ncbi:hypothetical protein FOA52_000275 [Chlamydomonas sp. UWO 241]|nr:hypothetical protein FOA52_000275 [Chlamydomonas sp. UWO 241]
MQTLSRFVPTETATETPDAPRNVHGASPGEIVAAADCQARDEGGPELPPPTTTGTASMDGHGDRRASMAIFILDGSDDGENNGAALRPIPLSPTKEVDGGRDDERATLMAPPRKPAVEHRWCLVPCLLFIIFIGIASYYMYVRFTTITSNYAIFIIAIELIGLSSFTPYAILLCRGVFSTGSPGLDPADPKDLAQLDDATMRFNVHVLVPCYKEALEIIVNTINATLGAPMPHGGRRTIYLLDDGNSPEKRAFIASLRNPTVKYITGRDRKPGQINGKSENLNNALCNHIYKDHPKAENGSIDWTSVDPRDTIVVFDADMMAKPDFFCKTLEVMADEELALCLTPQAFHNINPDGDLFNNINKQFWEYWLPGAFAWGYIACTGTNFVLRARPLAHCGWFPNMTITEDYALGMELKKRQYKATYLMQYVAEGEAPEDIRQVFQQRSRWTKGHYQVFLSSGNPLFIKGLPFFQRLWYCYAAWAPLCNTVTTPVFFAVPFVSILFGYHPVSISYKYVFASTLFFASILSIQFFARSFLDLKLLWYANISNTVLWFTQTKAFFNTILARMGFKLMVFKATAKTKKDGDGDAGAALVEMNGLEGDDGRPPTSDEFTPVLGPAHASSNSALLPSPSPRKNRRHVTIAASVASAFSAVSTPFKSPFQKSKGSNSYERAPFDDNDVSTLSYSDVSPSKDTLRRKVLMHFAAAPAMLSSPTMTPSPAQHKQLKYTAGEPGTDRGTSPTRSRPCLSVCAEPLPTFESDDVMSPCPTAIDEHPDDLRTATFDYAHHLHSSSHKHKQSSSLAGWGGSSSGGSSVILTATTHKGGGGSDGQGLGKGALVNTTANTRKLAVGVPATVPAPNPPKPPSRIQHMMASFAPDNVTDWWAVFDPLAIVILFVFTVATGCFGMWQLATGNNGSNNNSFALGSTIQGSPYLIIATLWAWYNVVAPYLFLHYCFTVGPSFRFMAKWLGILSMGVFMASIIVAWMLIPIPVGPATALDLQIENLYPSSIALDTNTNYNFVAGISKVPLFGIPAGANLTGGLLAGFSNVKHGMPLAYTLTMLAWAMLKFPETLSGRDEALHDTLRSGADYLMRCDLNPGSLTAPMFVAQVGDAAPYVVLDNTGFDPVESGKKWSAPWDDPQLVGTERRDVWVMTRDHVGADLLSSVAAALAAVGTVLRTIDPLFSERAILKAREVYLFATRNEANPRSYCDFVPCTTNVTITREIVVKEMEGANGTLTHSSISDECYYIEWITKTCRIGSTLDVCTTVKEKSNDVYATRLDCCNAVFPINIVSGQTPQGICAVPADQWKCYVADPAQRTCFEELIDPATGVGCTGRGMDVFSSSLACCEFLSKNGFIKPDENRAGMGLCALTNLDPTFTKCWIPSLAFRTCLEGTGKECAGYGLETSYDTTTACCNRVAAITSSSAMGNTGKAQVTLTGPCGANTYTFAPFTTRRHLLQKEDKAVAPTNKGEAVTNNSSNATATALINTWKVPDFYRDDTCLDGNCRLMTRSKTVTMPIYNSTSVLDDMAWAGVWLHIATSEQHYLGQSQRYMARHYRQDLDGESLKRDRSYYVTNWNNVAWATNVLLAELTNVEEYHDRILSLLGTWIHGGAVDTGDVLPQHQPSERFDPTAPVFENFTDPTTGKLVIVIPECKPTAFYEVDCFDLIDDDCNGLVDREDPACGLFPVLYTTNKIAFTTAPTLPNAANTAFLAMVYASHVNVSAVKSRQLQCWGLGQGTYMLGGRQDVRSYVVGYGPSPPKIVQHRGSSCVPPWALNTTSATEVEPCTWDTGFFPSMPNPGLSSIAGALVWGPSDGTDAYDDDRRSSDTRVTLEDNVGFTGLLAGLAENNIGIESCYLGHGVYQRYFPPAGRI